MAVYNGEAGESAARSQRVRGWLSLLLSFIAPTKCLGRASYMGCDIHTDAHAQYGLYNISVEGMGTVGSL